MDFLTTEVSNNCTWNFEEARKYDTKQKLNNLKWNTINQKKEKELPKRANG